MMFADLPPDYWAEYSTECYDADANPFGIPCLPTVEIPLDYYPSTGYADVPPVTTATPVGIQLPTPQAYVEYTVTEGPAEFLSVYAVKLRVLL